MSRYSARSAKYKQAHAQLKAEQLPCALCHHPINYELTYPHPYSFSVDHAIPRSYAPHADETIGLRPAHLVCNQRRSNKTETTSAQQRAW